MTSRASRSDTLTQSQKIQEIFSDFSNSFAMSPFGNQLGRVTNEKAVEQSVKNIIKTNLGERFFRPSIGSNLLKSLFELNTSLTVTSLEFYIKNSLKNNEPRINLLDVSVIVSKELENSINIIITYNLINNSDPIIINFILKRVR